MVASPWELAGLPAQDARPRTQPVLRPMALKPSTSRRGDKVLAQGLPSHGAQPLCAAAAKAVSPAIPARERCRLQTVGRTEAPGTDQLPMAVSMRRSGTNHMSATAT